MLQSNKVDEEEEALLTLWTLSFDPESKKRIEEELGTLLPAVEQKLSEFKTSGQENASTSAHKSDQPTTEAACVTIEAEQEEDPEVALNNRKRKKQAAERALRGLIWQLGISEAQYAYHMKKPILFLRVQPAYRPDGWLGIMLGARIYLDFSGKYPFEKKFQELLFSVNKVANLGPEHVDRNKTTVTINTTTTTSTTTTTLDENPKPGEVVGSSEPNKQENHRFNSTCCSRSA
ncbi:hypothetical protein D915_008356 [Fasciola hepatica]|uniref:Uncharacterized protein n=1 Tax=Fasciola hepatica TaxID=6192 RepID=A0A4E0RHD3_FASHE|nr:hypothetical protein D915_008356 [Fasciola hepatica]